MGIKGLNKVLATNGYTPETYTPNAFFKSIQHENVAIDISIFLYSYCSISGDKYLELFIKQIIFLLQNNIVPIYIFDGKPTDEKTNLIKKRKENHKKRTENIKEEEMELINNFEASDGDYDKMKNKKNTLVKITPELIENIMKLLSNLGIFYYQYNGESDLFLRYLFEKKLIKYVISNDMDLITHGCERLIMDFNTGTKKIRLYENKKILEKLNMTHKSFIDMCILLGCDYTGTVNSIGPVSAVNFIKAHGSIEKIIEEKPDKNFETMDYQLARHMFLQEVIIPETLTKKDFRIKNKTPELEEFLKNNNIKKEMSDLLIKTLDKYIKIKKKTLLL